MNRTIIFILVGVFFILAYQSFVSAQANCWSYNTQATCQAVTSCTWKSDQWGSWCEELNCWNLNNQSACMNTAVPGKNCTWTSGGMSNWCEETNCWTYAGTNESACVNSTIGLSCSWFSECSGGANCWSITDQSLCGNTTGCSWGTCSQRSCGDYATQASCTGATGNNGKACRWNTNSNYCYEASCWEYTNSSACTSNSCRWNNDYCTDISCYNWDYNETGCVNASTSYNLTCTWSSPFCNTGGCWNYNNQSTCTAKPRCTWRTQTSTGWCEEFSCWTWDSWRGGNRSICENNGTIYGLNCLWEGNPTGDNVTGWCYRNFTATTSCTNLTTEMGCMNSYYCFWDYFSSQCRDPGDYTFNNTVFTEWNPGCYIFDLNETSCNATIGCSWAGTSCSTTNANMQQNGINCTSINSSVLCSSIPVLSSCCAWEGSACAKNQYSTSCWSQMQQPPAGASFCEDYSAFTSETLCRQIANHPWYMPCRWDNSSSRCKFKSSDVFGNSTDTLVLIDNKQACEAAGGKWIIENYCEGNMSVPAGRCENKFDEERNCDKACFACEYKSDGSAHNSTAAARSACISSLLGFCKFDENVAAPNGFGYCKAKDEIATGREGVCSSDCGACTFYGDPTAAESTNRPRYYCENSGANCKWIADPDAPTDESRGFCVSKSEKTCADICDRCSTQSSCVNIGRTATANISGGCSWDSSQELCTQSGQNTEICWDGVDNTNDGLIDCADPGCYADSFCGYVSGSCFGYTDNSTCTANSCEWRSDAWGSWCDFRGSSCWQNAGNETQCRGAVVVLNETLNITLARMFGDDINETYNLTLANLGSGWVNNSVFIKNASGAIISGNYTVDYVNQKIRFLNSSYMELECCINNLTYVQYQHYLANASCQWSTGTGMAFCEQDWSITEQCMRIINSTLCAANGNCTWSADTWCTGAGNTTEWCQTQGGWCNYRDFAPRNCWLYDGSQSACTNNNCTWTATEWQYCTVQWSNYSSCWSYATQPTCETNSCGWHPSGWCTNPFDVCTAYTAQATCSANANCNWNQWNYCEAKCYQQNLTENSCNSIQGCRWAGGWCSEPFSGSTCSNATNYGNQTSCGLDANCKWHSPGWCDPVGFSGGGAQGGAGYGGGGMNCYRHDGNQTTCINQTGCSWFPESQPFCSIDWSRDCWQYTYDSTCASAGCYWNTATSVCMNPSDQCWANSSLQTEGACNANAACDWSGSSCQSGCFNTSLTQATCAAATGCKWMSGWCNSGGTVGQFENMTAGEPVMLGMDTIGDAYPASIDIVGFGMKDMGNAFGFGVRVADLSNSSICNNEKLQNGVFGNGDETHKLFIYLDTDGSRTGGCTLQHDATAVGYEFRFRYESVWNSTNNKAVETLNSFKCDNGAWKAADIKISSWKKLMCSELGGSMLAIEKSDLNKFPTLYNSSADMRVYASTANQSTNASSPSDSVGPGYTTPGSVDFEIQDFFKYGADTAKYEDILKKGFVQYEDCFTSADDDSDGLTNCNDYDCVYASQCAGQGVNAAGYTDTKAPQVSGVKVEEYTDSALIMYDTDKPTNGTIEFYLNDSRCTRLNATVYDIGIRKARVRDYKVWHTGEIYNDGGAASLNYALANGTTYYYKLKVCDNGGKCAVSRCSSFRTVESAARCGYCSFVTRIKTPSGWTVSYDADQEGTYEHIQGAVCGPNAGMKMNYTDGRRVDIKMSNTDNTSIFWFINTSLTKTGLNDKVRTITNTSNLKNGTTTTSAGATIGYAGMLAETRDKIVNNLHPEVCRVKIPGAGSCTALWHCGDNLSGCVDRSSAATLIETGSTYCIWQLPFCEFSVWAGGQPGTYTPGSSSSSSSGGGGGGGGASNKASTYVVTDEQFAAGYTKQIKAGDKMKFNVEGEEHLVILNKVTSTSAQINVSSTVQQATLSAGEEMKFEVTGDNYYDVFVRLDSIDSKKNQTNLTIKKVYELIAQQIQDRQQEQPVQPELPVTGETTAGTDINEGSESQEGQQPFGDSGSSAIIIFVLAIVAILGYFYYHGHHHIRKIYKPVSTRALSIEDVISVALLDNDMS